MSEDLGYEPPLRTHVSVRDRWGSADGFLTNDGDSFTLEFRGNRFEGNSPDALEWTTGPEDSPRPPDLDGGDLCGYTMTWSLPIRVRVDAGTEQLPLALELTVPDRSLPGPPEHPYGVSLTLRRGGDVVAVSGHASDMEQALPALQRDTPEGMRIETCASCAFSDYHPGGYGFMGSLGCFRNKKEEFAAVEWKTDLYALWKDRAGDVQETYSCADYAR
ncbi:DUF6304 family protein [Streptomyces sp. NPDC096068]|uniref:DUF6304 family protein n=1 Tax=Streptomyces sp. NPDC096068 TaxID=3155424 RepID=UPI003320ECD1